MSMREFPELAKGEQTSRAETQILGGQLALHWSKQPVPAYDPCRGHNPNWSFLNIL